MKNPLVEIGLFEWGEKMKNFLAWRDGKVKTGGYKNIHYEPAIVFNLKEIKGVVLDIGCGAGINEKIPFAFYYGIDPFGQEEIWFKKLAEGNCKFIKGKGEEILASWFSEDQLPFDFVLCFSMLQHSISPIQVLRNAWKLLKIGGKIYSTVCLCQDDKDPMTTHCFKTAAEALDLFGAYFEVRHWFEMGGVIYIIGEK